MVPSTDLVSGRFPGRAPGTGRPAEHYTPRIVPYHPEAFVPTETRTSPGEAERALPICHTVTTQARSTFSKFGWRTGFRSAGGQPAAQLRIVNADVSTVTAAADRVLLVEEEEPWILHVELQSGRDVLLPARTQMYNTLIGWRHGLAVRSLIVLLRPAADGAELTGVFERGFPDESPYLTFRYQIVRIWQLPVETCLDGGLGLVPLAPLGAVTEAELPAVIGRMRQRIDHEATAEEAATLWTAADVLMGLRYSRELVSELLRGVQNMKESVTYQAIVEEGVEKGRLEEHARCSWISVPSDSANRAKTSSRQSSVLPIWSVSAGWVAVCCTLPPGRNFWLPRNLGLASIGAAELHSIRVRIKGMSYSTEISKTLTETLARFATLNPHQLAGHVANIDFWLSEVRHCIEVINGYGKRFEAMTAAQKKYVAEKGTLVYHYICKDYCSICAQGRTPKLPYRVPHGTLKKLVASIT